MTCHKLLNATLEGKDRKTKLEKEWKDCPIEGLGSKEGTTGRFRKTFRKDKEKGPSCNILAHKKEGSEIQGGKDRNR